VFTVAEPSLSALPPDEPPHPVRRTATARAANARRLRVVEARQMPGKLTNRQRA
jgi:hypothetical protein